jgi:hypothetical protein
VARVYYVGDWAVLTGPVFAETPFHYSHKGLDIYNYGHWLKSALEATGEHQVVSVPSWDFYNKFRAGPLTFPDRIRLTLDAVRAGKGLMLLGGWYSFTGEMGKGGWGRTPLAAALPVRCLEVEDLVESTEGFSPVATRVGRSFFAGLDVRTMPPLLGYNKTLRRPDATVLLEVTETGDPLLAVRPLGKGRVLAYTSDPAPHWGCNFVYWAGYGEFWRRCLDYARGGPLRPRAVRTPRPSRRTRPPAPARR